MTFDLRVHGQRPALLAVDGAVTYAELADRVESLLTRLGPSRRLVLLRGRTSVDFVVALTAALTGGHPVIVAPPLRSGQADEVRAIYNPDVVTKVEKAILEEVERLLKDGIPADELAKAKQGWLQSQELSRSNDRGIASKLDRSLRTGQTLTYDADLETKVGALTSEQVLAALKKYVDPKRLVIVTAGDFKKSAEK